MRFRFSIALWVICSGDLRAQSDTVRPPHADYAKHIYSPETNTFNFSYDYSNKWDLNGDGKMDSLYFIGNGGAHVYFFLRVILSSDGNVRDYPFLQLDMPWCESQESLQKRVPGIWPQFVPADFNNDGATDLYLDFDNPFGHLPKAWKALGIKTKRVIMSFSGGKLKIRNS